MLLWLVITQGWHKAWLDRAQCSRDILSDPCGSRLQVRLVQCARGLSAASRQVGHKVHHAVNSPEAALAIESRCSCYARPTLKAFENPSLCLCIIEALFQCDRAVARPVVHQVLGWFSGLLGKDPFLAQRWHVVSHLLVPHKMVCM